tara:strand:- start:340 stop:621 length:282 start_codon:yes stop_codon:yes gene_type:complete
VWKNIAVVAIFITTPAVYTTATDISTTSATFVEIIYAIAAVYGVAVFALIENEVCVYLSTVIAFGSEESEADYDGCIYYYNIHNHINHVMRSI